MSEEHAGVQRCVLVIDDDESIRELITLALEDEGFRVICAPEGETALKMIPEICPDVILLDNRMPVMDGSQFIGQYREQFGHRAPLIVLSAVENPEQVAKETGADGFLPKPFDLSELIQVVSQAVSADD